MLIGDWKSGETRNGSTKFSSIRQFSPASRDVATKFGEARRSDSVPDASHGVKVVK